MPLPFRNADKDPGIYPANSVVSVFARTEDAEAAVAALDENGFGEDLVYAGGEEAHKLTELKNQGVFAHIYRALQSVMSDELSVIRQYEKEIDEGSLFVRVPLEDAGRKNEVGAILKAHNPSMVHFLGRTSFQSL